MKNLIKLLVFFVLISDIAGCSANIDADAAQAEVDNFHKLMDLMLYSEIYNGMATESKEEYQESKVLKMLSMIRSKLGKCDNIKFIYSSLHKSIFGAPYIVLKYNVTCEHGNGTETFALINEKGKIRISGYNMDSNEFFKPDTRN